MIKIVIFGWVALSLLVAVFMRGSSTQVEAAPED
jgi:hypothetical protein